MYKKGSSFEARLHVLRYKFNFASHCKALRKVNWNSRIVTGTIVIFVKEIIGNHGMF
jgi:hypothetical protein